MKTLSLPVYQLMWVWLIKMIIYTYLTYIEIVPLNRDTDGSRTTECDSGDLLKLITGKLCLTKCPSWLYACMVRSSDRLWCVNIHIMQIVLDTVGHLLHSRVSSAQWMNKCWNCCKYHISYQSLIHHMLLLLLLTYKVFHIFIKSCSVCIDCCGIWIM